MAKRSARERLRDIAGAIDKIALFLQGKNFENFKTEPLLHDAVVRNLEIVSEASRHVPSELKARTPQIPWRQIADFGNVLRHGYEGVNDPILRDTIQRNLPPLLGAVHALLGDPDIT